MRIALKEVITMKLVGIIGAGKVGVSFGIGCPPMALRIGGYYRKRRASASTARRIPGRRFTRHRKSRKDNDVVLIAALDDAIETIWRQLLQLNIRDKTVCHTAGSLSSSLFFWIVLPRTFTQPPFHPMLAISSREEGYKSLDGAFFTLEGDPAAVEILSDVLSTISLQSDIRG